MQTPTAEEVRLRSPLLRQRYGAAPGEREDDLLALIEDAAAVVADLTGRKIAPVETGEEVPTGLVMIAVRATARMAEMIDTESEASFADKEARGRRVRSISAGPWSESYFAPGELIVKGGRPQFSADSALDRLLWALATEEKKDALMALVTGVHPPAGGVTSFDYRRSGDGRVLGPQVLGAGPDGW